jgi:hypothetical protein
VSLITPRVAGLLPVQNANVLVTGTLGLAAGTTPEAMRKAVAAAKEASSHHLWGVLPASLPVYLCGGEGYCLVQVSKKTTSMVHAVTRCHAPPGTCHPCRPASAL